MFLTGTSKLLSLLALITLAIILILPPIFSVSRYLSSSCSIQSKQYQFSPVSTGSNFPDVYLHKDEKITVLKVDVPSDLNEKRQRIFLRRAATLIRHTTGDVIAYLTFNGTLFSEKLSFFNYIAQTKRGEGLTDTISKFIPRRQQFVLAKGCDEN